MKLGIKLGMKLLIDTLAIVLGVAKIEERLGLAELLACMRDARNPYRISKREMYSNEPNCNTEIMMRSIKTEYFINDLH
jgi:spore maturation protein SpmA